MSEGLVVAQSSVEADQDGGRIMCHARQIIFQVAEVGDVQKPICCHPGATNPATTGSGLKVNTVSRG